MRNASSSKAYNIITGATLPVPPTLAPRDHPIDRRTHASNLANPHFQGKSVPPRGSTAPTNVGPIPEAHKTPWCQWLRVRKPN